jgi:hypothetical protein
LWCSMLLRLWNTKVGVPDQSYYLHLAMQVKIDPLKKGSNIKAVAAFRQIVRHPVNYICTIAISRNLIKIEKIPLHALNSSSSNFSVNYQVT